ncbi:MAG: C13 family peptidase [Xanthomonadaceae bacterium]|nr:C13 family peptidase [Xanthomonadaceae bacterium]
MSSLLTILSRFSFRLTLYGWVLLLPWLCLETSAGNPANSASGKSLDAALDRLAPQREDVPDLYVVGFAGDASEAVFGNEVVYLSELFQQRFKAGDRIITLINSTGETKDRIAPEATPQNLSRTLSRIGELMDPQQDVLLLFLTSHGLDNHELHIKTRRREEFRISPEDLRHMLDDAGIRNRVIVISACYSGGFIPALSDARTLVITASRADRSSFGCGTASRVTYFGRAWLVEALNQTTDFISAYQLADETIRRYEKQQRRRPSSPQIFIGDEIVPVLDRWQYSFQPGAPVPYPF